MPRQLESLTAMQLSTPGLRLAPSKGLDDQEGVARGTHLWILRREGPAWRVALVTWQAEE
jgi:hypothetical protein